MKKEKKPRIRNNAGLLEKCTKENCDCPENCECKGGYWKCHNHD